MPPNNSMHFHHSEHPTDGQYLIASPLHGSSYLWQKHSEHLYGIKVYSKGFLFKGSFVLFCFLGLDSMKPVI